LLFTSRKLLSPDDVADRIVGVLDDYKLVVVHPRGRGALARILAPFPRLGLVLLEQYRRLGEHNRRQRVSTPR